MNTTAAEADAPRRICFRRCLFVCLSVSNFAQKLRNRLHEIFTEGWQWDLEQVINFGGNPDHLLDTGIVFPDLSLLGDTESG